MRFSLRAKCVAVGLHLALVALGAAQFKWATFGSPGRVIEYYGILSGSGSGYGFFAPGVGTGLRVEFDLIDDNGTKAVDRLETGPNREANLRLGNILGLISRNLQEERIRRSVTASWAGKMFARHASARQITVRAETLDPPSMESYLQGTRSDWATLYRGTFIRKRAP